MKLSSLDIRKQQFSRIVRGYDRDEVDAFLEMVGTQWQEQVDDLRRAEEKQKEMKLQLEHYQKVEEALEEAIKGARTSAERKIESAEAAAATILEKAEARAVRITIGAEEDRLKIKRETARYSIRQKEMLSKFKAFLTTELEMLAYHEKEDVLAVKDFDPEELAEFGELETEDVHDLEAKETKGTGAQKSPGDGSEADDLASEKAGSAGDEVSEKSESEMSESNHDEARQSGARRKKNRGHRSTPRVTKASDEDENAITQNSEDNDDTKKHPWTVNTLLGPEESEDSDTASAGFESDRAATPPNGDMRAAQEEIENLRKLLKDLE